MKMQERHKLYCPSCGQPTTVEIHQGESVFSDATYKVHHGPDWHEIDAVHLPPSLSNLISAIALHGCAMLTADALWTEE